MVSSGTAPGPLSCHTDDSFEDAASSNCDSLVARAMSIGPNEPEVLMALASIRMSQSKFDEAKAVVQKLYTDMEGRDPCEYVCSNFG